MTDFTLTSAATCDVCGATLGSSDDSCEHDSDDVKTYVFREIGSSTLEGVYAVPAYEWNALEQKVGDEWIAYELLGSMATVNSKIKVLRCTNIEEIPKQTHPINGPLTVNND